MQPKKFWIIIIFKKSVVNFLISFVSVVNYYKIYKIKDLIASNGPLISRGINKRRLKRDKTE